MVFSLSGIILSCILFANAIAILNDERFLKKYGWGYVPGDIPDDSIKGKLVYLLYSIRTVIRIPLLILNIIAIVLLVLFG